MAQAQLVVHATVDPTDSALGNSVGWQGGVPGATVWAVRNGTAEWLSLPTGADGRALFAPLVPGLYALHVIRVLSADERSRAGGVVRAFGGGRTLDVSSPVDLDVALIGDRPGSLVISELGHNVPLPWETGDNTYADGLYLELYNNSDSTIYLDGVVFGANPVTYRSSLPTPCEMSEPVRNDSAGVYARWLLAFPGDGMRYPIKAGESRVVAMAAVDHRPVHPTLPDLSGADFEISGARNADNPAVPNMRDVGLERFYFQLLFAIRTVYFLARPLSVEQLPIVFRDGNGRGYVRVSRAQLLDVVAFGLLWPERDLLFPPCVPMIHPVFDRREGLQVQLGEPDPRAAEKSLQRSALRVTPDGRVILMNTNTTAVDFVVAPRTPGSIPER